MNLILQAIKSLFSKVENSISVNVVALSKKINMAQNTANTAKANAATAQTAADNAQTAADNAQTAADNAQTAADNAQTAANHILSATVSDYIATVTTPVTLKNGNIYVVIPTSTSSSTIKGRIKVNGKDYSVYAAVVDSTSGHISLVGKAANMLFAANFPLPVMYSDAKQAFYALNSMHKNYVEVSTDVVDPNASQYIYSYYTSNSARRIRYMRVRSSTQGSSKLFDIQVDDSGTITAVEVT